MFKMNKSKENLSEKGGNTLIGGFLGYVAGFSVPLLFTSIVIFLIFLYTNLKSKIY